MGCALAAAEEQAAVSAFFAGGVQELDLTQDSSPNELLAALSRMPQRPQVRRGDRS